MNKLDKQNNDVVNSIQNILLKYCPITNDRLFLIDDYRSCPVFDIELNYAENGMIINFLYGTYAFKSLLPERLKTNEYITFSEISNLVNFILFDHGFIKSINIDNDSFINLVRTSEPKDSTNKQLLLKPNNQ